MPNLRGERKMQNEMERKSFFKVRGKFISYHFCTGRLKDRTVSKILLYYGKQCSP